MFILETMNSFIQFEKVSQQNKTFSDVTIFKRRTLLRSFKAINLIINLNSTILKGWIIILPEMVSWWSSWSLIGQIVGCLRLDITVSQTGWLLLRFRNIWRNRLFKIVPRFETEIGTTWICKIEPSGDLRKWRIRLTTECYINSV